MLFFKSTPIANTDDDTEAVVRGQLDNMLKDVQEFEADLLHKWGN